MKKIIMLGVLIASGAMVSVADAVCSNSCTAIARRCVSMGASQSACFAGMSECLKTGSLSMPSGRVFTGLCKR